MTKTGSKVEPQFSEPLEELVDSLRQLPGVGERSARRMAYHLLQYDPAGGLRLAAALDNALNHLRHCKLCNSFTMDEVCATCSDEARDHSVLCVVETPVDQNMIESTRSYQGLYYVLMRIVLERRLNHGGHPILRWNMDNAYVRTDPAGNLKIDKERSTEKVDGAVALVMALDRAMKNQNTGSSVYDERGLLFI